MYGKQMNFFEDGGLYDEGGMMDEVSGNDVPPGSTRKEVRDDVPAMLSEGEFVFPADVVRYFGLERLMEMRQQAKMGLKKMEAMGQMGNSEEATMPDDLPFTADDLLIMIPQEEPEEMARGGVVKAQTGTFVQPSGFQDATLNTPNFVPPSSVAPVNPQGTPTGYLPTFVGQSVIVPTGQNEVITQSGGTGVTDTTADTGTDFVPTVTDVYEFRKYKNAETGEIKEYAFYMGQPVIPIPDGWVPYVEEDTTTTEDVTDTTVESATVRQEPEGRDGDYGQGPSFEDKAREVLDAFQSAKDPAAYAKEQLESSPTLAGIPGLAGGVIGGLDTLSDIAQARGYAKAIESTDPAKAAEINKAVEAAIAKSGFGIKTLESILATGTQYAKTFTKLMEEQKTKTPTKTTTTKTTTTPTRPVARPTTTTTVPSNVPSERGTGTGAGTPAAATPSVSTSVSSAQSAANMGFGSDRGGEFGGTSTGGGTSSSGGTSSGGQGGGGADSGQAANGGTSSGGMSSAESAAAMGFGTSSGGEFMYKGGLAAPKQKANKRSVNKDRGVAARKKK